MDYFFLIDYMFLFLNFSQLDMVSLRQFFKKYRNYYFYMKIGFNFVYLVYIKVRCIIV